jgi:GT2 family glycosyltransferase
MDDDALAQPQWVEVLLRGFKTKIPQPGAIGGRVYLKWEGGKAPEWLSEKYMSIYSCLDYGDDNFFLSEEKYLVGVNMAFPREVLSRCGGFERRFGRQGQILVSGDEAALIGNIRKANLPIYYAPDAIVHHRVPESRQTKKWFFSRMFWDGVSQIFLKDYQTSNEGMGRSEGLREILFHVKKLFILLFQWMAGKKARFDTAVEITRQLGRCYALIKEGRH